MTPSPKKSPGTVTNPWKRKTRCWPNTMTCCINGRTVTNVPGSERLLDRLSPRIHLPISIYLIDHQDPRLAYCNEAARIS